MIYLTFKSKRGVESEEAFRYNLHNFGESGEVMKCELWDS